MMKPKLANSSQASDKEKPKDVPEALHFRFAGKILDHRFTGDTSRRFRYVSDVSRSLAWKYLKLGHRKGTFRLLMPCHALPCLVMPCHVSLRRQDLRFDAVYFSGSLTVSGIDSTASCNMLQLFMVNWPLRLRSEVMPDPPGALKAGHIQRLLFSMEVMAMIKHSRCIQHPASSAYDM